MDNLKTESVQKTHYFFHLFYWLQKAIQQNNPFWFSLLVSVYMYVYVCMCVWLGGEEREFFCAQKCFLSVPKKCNSKH